MDPARAPRECPADRRRRARRLLVTRTIPRLPTVSATPVKRARTAPANRPDQDEGETTDNVTRVYNELRAVNRELATASRTKAPPSRLFDLDLAFHSLYVEGAAGPRVQAIHRAIKPQSERYARLYVNVLLDELPTSVKEHEIIAAAI